MFWESGLASISGYVAFVHHTSGKSSLRRENEALPAFTAFTGIQQVLDTKDERLRNVKTGLHAGM